MTGWVGIQRKLIKGEHPFFRKSPMTEAQAFGWMIASAAYEDTTHDVNGVEITVPRGSFITTLRQMQGAFMWASDKRVRDFLKRLENGRMIGRKKDARKTQDRTHITICNYEEYQTPGRKKDARKTQERRSDGRLKVTSIKQTTNNNTPAGGFSEIEEKVIFWAGLINSGKYVSPSSIRPDVARAMLVSGKVTPEQLRERGITA